MGGRNQKQIKQKNKVIIVSLVTAICLLGDSMLYIALPIYWHQAGLLSLWEVGIILSINRFIRLPLNPIIGFLYTKISLRTGLIVSVVLTTMTTVGYGIGEGLWIWLILRSVWGLAWSFLRLGGLFTVIMASEDHNRGYLMGTYNGLYRLGSLFGMLLGGVLSSLLGLKVVAVMFGLIALIGIPAILVFIPKGTTVTDKEQNKQKDHRIKINWTTGVIRNVIVCGFFISLLFQGILTSTLSFVIDRHFSDLIMVLGIAVTSAALSGYLQGVRWVWEPFLAARIGSWSDGPKGRMPLFIWSLIFSAAGLICIPIQLPLYLWIIIVLLVMVTATSLTTLMDTITTDAAKTTNAVSLMTIYSVSLDLGAALGPMLAYFLLSFQNGIFYLYFGGAIILILITRVSLLKEQTRNHAQTSA